MNSSSLPTSGVSPPEEKIDVDKLVGQFVALRDRKKQIEDQHKKMLAPFTKVMDEIGGKLLKHMHDTGAESLRTPSGTASKLTKLSATIKDAAAFKDFVKTTGNFDLVDWKANANAVFAYIKQAEGVSPPGINASSYTTVGVRRPTEKAED